MTDPNVSVSRYSASRKSYVESKYFEFHDHETHVEWKFEAVNMYEGRFDRFSPLSVDDFINEFPTTYSLESEKKFHSRRQAGIDGNRARKP